MKTSNKILSGFFILVFAMLPVFILLGFHSRISNGVFTPNKPEVNNNDSVGAIKPFKVLKVVGPGIEGVLICHIIPANSATYTYNNNEDQGQDGVKLQQKGDTLLITYSGMITSVNRNSSQNIYPSVNVNLYLPAIENVIAEGADITIDSIGLAANPVIHFDLKKRSVLNLGMNGSVTSENFEKKIDTGVPGKSGTTTSIITEKSSGQFNRIIIKATDSKITLGINAWIKDLNLQLLGLSTIKVDDYSRMNQLSGFISDSAKVEADWKNIRRLATLTGK